MISLPDIDIDIEENMEYTFLNCNLSFETMLSLFSFLLNSKILTVIKTLSIEEHR